MITEEEKRAVLKEMQAQRAYQLRLKAARRWLREHPEERVKLEQEMRAEGKLKEVEE